MKNFIVYNQEGEILRTGFCSNKDFYLQANRDGEFVMEGKADDKSQKIIGVGISGRIVNKTPEEIERDKPTLPEPEQIPIEKKQAVITNEQWQDVLNRISTLEGDKAIRG